MCRICRTKHPKGQLTRWVQRDGQWLHDERQRLNGRGSYACSEVCAQKLSKVKVKA